MTQPIPDPYQRRPVDISAYAPPPRRSGAIWFALVGLIAVGAVIAALVLKPWNPPTPSPTPTPTTGTTSALPGQPFTMPDDPSSTGRWGITSTSWNGDSVTVDVWVESDAGNVSYGFVAFSNAGTVVYDPTTGAPSPTITWGDLTPGQRAEGNLRFEMPAGDATLVLTTSAGNQVSALAIPA